MSSTALTERVPFRRRHAQQHSSMNAKSARVRQAVGSILHADTLVDRAGASLFSTSSRLLDERASQDNPGAGKGSFWVRSDDPTIAAFTDDSNTTIDLTQVTLAEVLATGNDATNQSMNDITQWTFATQIGIGDGATPAAATSIAIGAATTSALNAITIGNTSSADLASSLALGYNAYVSTNGNSTGGGGVAIGYKAYALGDSVCIGSSVDVGQLANQSNAAPSILIGSNSTPSSAAATSGVVAVGAGAEGGLHGVALGSTAGASSGSSTSYSVSIGHGSTTTATHAVNVGASAVSGYAAVSVGTGNTASGARSVVLGTSATAGNDGVAVGASVSALGASAVCVGTQAGSVASSTNSVGLGYYARASSTSANQVAVGYYAECFAANQMSLQSKRYFEQYATTTTTSAGPTNVIGFDCSNAVFANCVLRVDCSLVGRNTGGGTGFAAHTYMFHLKRYHFAAKAGTLSLVSNIETTTTNVDHQEVVQVDMTGAFAALAGRAGAYFLIYSANDETVYYVWNDTTGDGSTNEPIVDGATGIAVDTSGAGSDIAVAQALETAFGSFTDDFSVSRADEVVTITNVNLGQATAATNNDWDEATLTTIDYDPSVTLTAVGAVAQVRVSQTAGNEIEWRAHLRVHVGC